MEEQLMYHIYERWQELEPRLKLGDEIDEDLYDELQWFDMVMSQLYSWEVNIEDYQGYYMDEDINSKDDALKYIINISIDYDGYSSADNLRDLIDELREIAKTGLRK